LVTDFRLVRPVTTASGNVGGSGVGLGVGSGVVDGVADGEGEGVSVELRQPVRIATKPTRARPRDRDEGVDTGGRVGR
jgi:hypothetical protein